MKQYKPYRFYFVPFLKEEYKHITENIKMNNTNNTNDMIIKYMHDIYKEKNLNTKDIILAIETFNTTVKKKINDNPLQVTHINNPYMFIADKNIYEVHKNVKLLHLKSLLKYSAWESVMNCIEIMKNEVKKHFNNENKIQIYFNLISIMNYIIIKKIERIYSGQYIKATFDKKFISISKVKVLEKYRNANKNVKKIYEKNIEHEA